MSNGIFDHNVQKRTEEACWLCFADMFIDRWNNYPEDTAVALGLTLQEAGALAKAMRAGGREGVLTYHEATQQWFKRYWNDCDGDMTEIAKVLGWKRWRVYRRAQRYGLLEKLDGETG